MGNGTMVGQVLRASLSPDDPGAEVGRLVRACQPEDLTGLGPRALFHGVSGYVHAATSGLASVPQEERTRLERSRDGVVLSHLRTVSELSYLAKVFGAAAIPWMVIKGPTLAEPVHGAVELRSYGDLDILVPGSRLAEAMSVLEQTGSQVIDRNWTLIHSEMKGEVHLQLPLGTSLDLHWHLFNEAERRDLFPISIQELFARQREVDISGITVPTLSVADTIVYVALHTLHSGSDRLVWLKDIERLLSLEACDPIEVVEVAREWRADLVLKSALRRVEIALGACRHAEMIYSASGRHKVWLAVSSWAWQRSPVEEEHGGGSLGRIFARSTCRTSSESFAELRRRSTAHLRSRRAGEDQRRGRLAPEDPRSSLYDSGGARTRAAFLESVSRQEGTR